MIVVNYCRIVKSRGPCTSLMGLEVHQWYRERGSVYLQASNTNVY